MNPIAVWYHCKVSGTGIPNRDAALRIVREQMAALAASELAAQAQEIHIGINGTEADAIEVAQASPEKAILNIHGESARSELPTFSLLRFWLPAHGHWYIFYHHSKGVTAPHDPGKRNHRQAMEQTLVRGWRRCVSDLNRGFEAVGNNLLDPDTRPSPFIPGERYFVGNFWWARASYLLELPPLPETVTDWSDRQRCQAEAWIGRCPRRPVLLDYERPELYRFWVTQGRVCPT